MIASSVLITDTVHYYENMDVSIMAQSIRSPAMVMAEDQGWIGFGAAMLFEVVVGGHGVVGSSHVVTRSIPPFSLAVRNPARVVRRCGFESHR